MPNQTIRAERMAGIGRALSGLVIAGVSIAVMMTMRNLAGLAIGWVGLAVGVLVLVFGLAYVLWPPTLTLTDEALVLHGPFGAAHAMPWSEFVAFEVVEERGRRLVTYFTRDGKGHFLYGAWPLEAGELAALLSARLTASFEARRAAGLPL